jgi:hypothetical protein
MREIRGRVGVAREIHGSCTAGLPLCDLEKVVGKIEKFD